MARSNLIPRVAPILAESQHAQIHAMILSNRPTAKIADDVGCSERAVYRIGFTIKVASPQYIQAKKMWGQT